LVAKFLNGCISFLFTVWVEGKENLNTSTFENVYFLIKTKKPFWFFRRNLQKRMEFKTLKKGTARWLFWWQEWWNKYSKNSTNEH
jgi:hypothetical protein